MNQLTNKLGMLACLVGLALAGAGVGCEEKGPPADGISAGQPEATPTVSADDAEVDTKVLGILGKADALDGKTDKVVSKCAGCGLSMDGDPAHAAKIGEFTLHLCSVECKADFEKDPSKAVLALKVD